MVHADGPWRFLFLWNFLRRWLAVFLRAPIGGDHQCTDFLLLFTGVIVEHLFWMQIMRTTAQSSVYVLAVLSEDCVQFL